MRALLERVLGAIVGWALRFGRVPAGAEAALGAELTALVLTQRATFATPVC